MTRTNRGQTLQDYVIGIGIFILAVTFVLSLFPGYLSGFTAGADADQEVVANRIASEILINHSVAGTPKELNATKLNQTLNRDRTHLRQRYGISAGDSVNISVQSLDGSRIKVYNTDALAAGLPTGDRSAATSARVVTLTSGNCDPACRLVVTVW